MHTESAVMSSVSTSSRPTIALVAAGMDILGGQGVQATYLLEKLRRDGYAVTFIPVNPTFPRGLRWVRRIPCLRTVLNQLLFIPGLLALRHVDVVHVYSASYWSFLLAPVPAMLMARLFGKHLILNYHSGEASDHLKFWGLRVHPWLRLPDEIVVPSRFLQIIFAEHGYPSRVIPNVVDTTAFRYRDRTALTPRLLSTRNLERHYRVDVTILAFSIVKRRFPDATLTITGYGSQESSLRELARQQQCDGIKFIGRIEQAQMPAIYDAADIFVNSSVVDNQPVSILEAFAAGLVVVSTGTGDISAMITDGSTGVLVPAEDPQTLANRIISVLEHPAEGVLMTRRARMEVEKYAWSHVFKDWVQLYHREGLDETATPA